jgi:RsiW-degrading membrane proteinase PrsW (M82 family)
VTPSIERTFLQIAIGTAGCVPVFAGLAGAILGPTMTNDAGSMSLDSHVRYLSGLLLGIGLVFWWNIPRIERAGSIFRVLTLIVFIGGLARLYGAATQGVPPGPMVFGLVMELIITPALCVWQVRLARCCGS